MKKTFTLIFMIVGMIISPALSAQSFTPVVSLSGSQGYINARYTQSGKPLMVMEDNEQDIDNYNIYDENLNEVTSLSIPRSKGNGYKEVYTRVIEYNPDGKKREFRENYYLDSEEQALEIISQSCDYNVSEAELNGIKIYYPSENIELSPRYGYDNYFEYSIYGTKYPTRYFYITPSEDEYYKDKYYDIVIVDISDCYTKTDKWSEPVREEFQDYYHTAAEFIEVVDLNSGSEMNGMYLTQTLFNEDADYEYISTIMTLFPREISEQEYTKTIYYGNKVLGFTICSSSGKELQRVLISESNDLDISYIDLSLILIGDKKYFVADYSSYYSEDNYTQGTIFYTINANGSGLQQVAEPIKVRVAPTVIRHDENINVELNDLKGEGRLTVTDIAGRTVFSTNVHENGIHQIPARTLSNGMNVVTVNTSAGKKSTKVIVK